jgi:predicted RNA-binding protein YlqC (UPF0109 family)
MKDFVEYVAKALVDSPEEVHVGEVQSERVTIYELHVAKEDVGKVIGRAGRTAKAFRTLLAAVCAKAGANRAILEILE